MKKYYESSELLLKLEKIVKTSNFTEYFYNPSLYIAHL